MANDDFDLEYKRAVRAAEESDAAEPRALAAHYDRKANRIVVDLRNGASFMFPSEMAQGLAGASAADLAKVVVTPSGSGLRWPTVDADLSLPALMLGVFGSKRLDGELGRRRGRVTSEAKAATAGANGRKRRTTQESQSTSDIRVNGL